MGTNQNALAANSKKSCHSANITMPIKDWIKEALEMKFHLRNKKTKRNKKIGYEEESQGNVRKRQRKKI